MDIPHLDWDSFDSQFRWKQGEHVTLVGPTGLGKTTLATTILPRRDYTIVFATKKRDPLITKLRNAGYERVTDADGIHTAISKKFILAPPLGSGSPKALENQRVEFRKALETAFRQGNWTIYLDEARYICDFLGLSSYCELLWQQGRSLGTTLVAGTQRPVRVPLTAYDQATHLFFWRENDDRNLKTIGGLGGTDSKVIRTRVPMLDLHQVLYLNTRSGKMVTTKAKVTK